ncbi:CHAT domain-containing protein [Pseudogemmobacter bohemicus]|uniref:CHAT domain-containing protein n=1 Tax=Pseudogemmobacter bohemicus TaxID=2250708 RepID=UPI000DD35968|nr:CHAT domain-containing protein [Pseudogemmobacter bohemicus]
MFRPLCRQAALCCLALSLITAPAFVPAALAQSVEEAEPQSALLPGSGIPLPATRSLLSLKPEQPRFGFLDPLLAPLLESSRAKIMPAGGGPWVSIEEAARIMAETDAAALAATGPESLVFAQYLSDSLIESRYAFGSAATLARADMATEIERRQIAAAEIFADYFSGPILEIPTPSSTVRDHVLQWAVIELRGMQDFVASGRDSSGSVAENIVLYEAALFEWLQAMMSGPGAQAVVRHYRSGEAFQRLLTLQQRNSAIMGSLRSLFQPGENALMEAIQVERRAVEIPQLSKAMAETAADMDWLLGVGPEIMTTLLPYPVPLADTQEVLGDDEALVLTAVAGPYYLVFVVTKTDIAWHVTSLTMAEIDALAGEILSEIGVSDARGVVALNNLFSSPPQRVGERGWVLYRELLQPAQALIRDRQLVIVPAGAAAHFPWAILVASPPGQTRDYRELDWLIRHHAIRVVPAVEQLLQPVAEPLAPAEMRYIGFGDPVFDTGARNWSDLMFSGMLPDLTPLPGAAREVREVGALYGEAGRVVLTGAEASEAALYDLAADGRLREADVVHFATHALTSGDHSQLVSGMIALAPPPQTLPPPGSGIYASLDPIPDGALRDSEIRSLRLNAALVILSACKTVASESYERDGVTGLAAAFLHAGAQRVLATHWQVNNQAAIEITIAMMRRDPAVENPSEALRQAMLETLNKGGPRADPSWWAAFSLIGLR